MSKTTVTDIAKLAGVSKSTVSKVINCSGTISPETTERVRLLMKEMNFTPRRYTTKKAANNANKLKIVAFIVGNSQSNDIATSLVARVTKGLEASLAKQNINLIVTHLKKDGSLPACFDSSMVQGVFINNFDINEHAANILSKYPCVNIFGSYPTVYGADLATWDNEYIGKEAADYINSKGYNEIVCIAPEHNEDMSLENPVRGKVFSEEIRKCGKKVYNLQFTSDNNSDNIDELVERYLEITPRPKGIFLTSQNDFLIQKICEKFWSLGMDPVENLDIIVTTTTPVNAPIPVATIDFQPEAIGEIAAKMMQERYLAPELEARKVTTMPRIVENHWNIKSYF